ncbi:MAG: hypothetical protein OXE02_11315 [Chloroflexi bacterium]|nr:hypothetical protein [Chloroflexota bacterium]
MASPSEIEAQVRFALSQLPVRNAHHDFEHICRYLTQQFICSNVLPATGPVSAGGDQGRDFETFRTYLVEELGSHGAFLGLVSQGTIAFICTTQTDGLPAKLRQDIEKVCAFGHPVQEIRAFTLESVPVGTRHQLEAETQASHGVHLEFHDAESIANLLAQPEGFWIAEQFLSIPAKIQPEATVTDDNLSAEYLALRSKWQDKGSPNPTLGDFIDVKAGLREATFYQEEARADLPFWLGLVRQLLANPELPSHVQQRARYELVVATLRGTGAFRPIDDVARVYLDESLSESEPARLLDASTLLMYANTAVQSGLSSLMPTEIGHWNDCLTSRIQGIVTYATPNRRASLLFTLGYLGLHPKLTKAIMQRLSHEAQVVKNEELSSEPSNWADVPLPDMLTDVSLTLSAWTELMGNLEETPLFPIQSLADLLHLPQLLSLWSSHAEWRGLLDQVDEAIGQRSGKSALAARARDRALMLLNAGRRLDALEEFHRAKIDWWSGDTVRGSLLAMIIIARLYLELRLPQASKSYALAVAHIASSRGDEEHADLIPAGLLMAATADLAAGAWCSAVELYALGLLAQDEIIEDGIDWEKHEDIKDAFTNLACVSACARTVAPELASSIDSITERLGVRTIIEDITNAFSAKDPSFWESFSSSELAARPFADLGKIRYIRFSALGTDWTLATTNDIESVRIAERFAAAAQVMLAALAKNDLCLVETRINVRIENRQHAWVSYSKPIESLPSNDDREWVVRLAPSEASPNASWKGTDIELTTMLAMILREASLLPEADFSASLDGTFERGLGHKLFPGRPYDELAAAFTVDAESAIQRGLYNTPWECRNGSFATCAELRWQDGPGPTYSPDKASELLETRYQNLAKNLRITLVRLASSEEFLSFTEALRKEGWRDWHIMTAAFNIVRNYRLLGSNLHLLSEETREEIMRAAFEPESPTAVPVPIGLFTPDAMNFHRRGAMLSLVKLWGLECKQQTPDIAGIERLLARRYGYWDDDVPHEEPFSKGRTSGGLVVIEDGQPE